jgi:hypothetical protein
LSFPDEVSSRCLIGLDGRAGSLLGNGERVGPILIADFFKNADEGVLLTNVESLGAGLGEMADFLEKKPRMDF